MSAHFRRRTIFILCFTIILVISSGAFASTFADKSPGNFGYPLKSTKITKGFVPSATKYGPGHRGTDFEATIGTSVYAIADGQVIFAGLVAGRLYISIDHGNDIVSTSSVVTKSVKVSDVVKKDQLIGTSGKQLTKDDINTFHFSMRVKKVYVDPMLYITGKIPVREISLSPINSKSESLWTKIKKEAKQMIEAGIDFTNDVISSVQKDIDDFYDWLKQTGNAGIKKLNDDLKIAWDEYKRIKAKMVEKANEISKYVIEKSNDALKKAVTTFKKLQDQAVKTVKKLIDTSNEINNIVKSIVKKALKISSDFAQNIFDATQNLMELPYDISTLAIRGMTDTVFSGLRATFKVIDANFDFDFAMLTRELLTPISCIAGNCTIPVKKVCDTKANMNQVKSVSEGYKGSGNIAFIVPGINTKWDNDSGYGKNPTGIDYKKLGYEKKDIQYFSYTGNNESYEVKDSQQDLNESAKLMDEQIKLFAKENPGKKIDLLAHSLGGAVASLWLANYYDAKNKHYPKLGKIIMYAPVLTGTELADSGKQLDETITGRTLHNRLSSLVEQIPSTSTEAFKQVTEGGYVQKTIENTRIAKKYDIYVLRYGSDYVVTAGSEHIDGLKEIPLEERSLKDYLKAHFSIVNSDNSISQSQRILEGKKTACNTFFGSLKFIGQSTVVHGIEYFVGGSLNNIGI